MNIHAQFTGGNIRVLKIEGSHVYVQNELRDTTIDWFYWAFCVEDAQGQTLTFHFDKKWLGYYGPAVSHDLIHWEWLGSPDETVAGDTFTYAFAPGENRVYFAHNKLYHPAHFDAFCQANGLMQEEWCVSERGRSVPYIHFGEGDESIILTARHHACEATGNYVMEGVVRELLREPIPGLEVICIPFMDYDGVVDGDQGKSRAPYDHNRDYFPEKPAIYASVRRLRELAQQKPPRYAFDFHSPWHLGQQNDYVFIPQKHFTILKNMSRFSALWMACNTPQALPYSVTGSMPVGEDWNALGAPCFGTYMHATAGAELAFTVETPYHTCSGMPFDPERARETGRCFVAALRKYRERPLKISFTGELVYNDSINDWCKTKDGYDFMPLFRRVWGRLPDADYLVGSLATSAVGAQHDLPDEALHALKNTGFDLLSLDREQAGIGAILDACDRVGLNHIKEESEAVFVRELKGIRVGFMSVTCKDDERLKDKVQRVKAECDHLVMLVHSGNPYNAVPDACTQMLCEQLRAYGADIIVCNQSRIILPSIYEGGRLTVYGLGNLMDSDPGLAKLGCPVNPVFSTVLNLTLDKKDGKLVPRLSFRLMQIIHDPERKRAPQTVDTYDQWRKAPYDAYKETILYYANRFMPGINYTEPMAEYPIG